MLNPNSFLCALVTNFLFLIFLENTAANNLNLSLQGPSDGRSSQSSGLAALADATVERGPLREVLTNDTRNQTTPLVQVRII